MRHARRTGNKYGQHPHSLQVKLWGVCVPILRGRFEQGGNCWMAHL